MDINHTSATYKSEVRSGGINWLLVLTAILVVGLLAFYFFFGGKNLLSPENEGSYQAVFLTNGQAYFGKVSYKGSWMVLSDVYYLEAKDALQPEGDIKAAIPEVNSQQKIQLVKLGSELHGPEGQMFIAKDKVLFWENMKADSKVLEAINQYKGAAQ